MKLLVNYDFFEQIKNAREPFSPFKLVRNHKVELIAASIPFCVMVGAKSRSFLNTFCFQIVEFAYASAFIFILYYGFAAFNKDPYTKKASARLKKLVGDFKEINVDTNYNTLLDAEHYETKHRLKLNEKKMPYILESKYILLPSYINGEICKTSIMQEHIVGTKKYELSIGSPVKTKALKRKIDASKSNL